MRDSFDRSDIRTKLYIREWTEKRTIDKDKTDLTMHRNSLSYFKTYL